MLKKIFLSVLTIAIAAFLGGCDMQDVSTPEIPSHGENGNLKLTFRCARTSTRATDDSNNENLITSLHIFLYEIDADDDTEPVIDMQVSGLNDKALSEIKISLNKQQTIQLFGSDEIEGTCRMVAIANLPQGTILPDELTVSNLRKTTFESSLNSQTGTTPQASFTMFGDTNEKELEGNTNVTFKPDELGGSAEGNVILIRAAARITLNIQVPETLTEKDEEGNETGVTWTSQRENMQVLLDNGVYISAIDPGTLTDQPAEGSYFSIGAGKGYGFQNTGATGENAYPWAAKMPFYTLPNKWVVSPSETHRTSLTLIVPWKKGGEQSYRTCYYKVPITAASEIVRNTAYTINLKVNMLGSFTNDEPLEVTPSYTSVDWGSVPTPVDIKDYRYLVVNQKNYVADNTATIDIPFFSSHDVTVSDVTMTYQRFNMYGNNSDVIDIKIDENQNNLTEEKTGEKIFSYALESDAMGNNVLRINHPLTPWVPYRIVLNREQEISYTGHRDKTAAETAMKSIEFYKRGTGTVYSPYVIEATIHHSDKSTTSTFSEKITVNQYPGMWILADRNSHAPNTGPGNVYVNGNQGNNTTYGNVNGIANFNSTGTNNNPNMYVITINVLDADQQEYIIDDPRYYSVINLNNGVDSEASNNQVAAGWSNLATALYPNTNVRRRLTYYYPTNESVEFKNVIAPKIRVASSYGKTSVVTRDNGRRRCASYQEDGRPAGRWRLPTLGEMQFIINLSRTGKIPVLFSDNTTYLCAQGWVLVPAASTSNVTLSVLPNATSSNFVRCVYDEWYWTRFTPVTVNKNTFTWGDMPKANPEGTTN